MYLKRCENAFGFESKVSKARWRQTWPVFQDGTLSCFCVPLTWGRSAGSGGPSRLLCRTRGMSGTALPTLCSCFCNGMCPVLSCISRDACHRTRDAVSFLNFEDSIDGSILCSFWHLGDPS